MKKLISTILMTIATLTAGIVSADELLMTLSVQRLSLESAEKIAQGAIAACRKEGIQISVAVVDRNGILQVQMRDTLAAPISLKISRQKAFTSANFNAATSQLGSRANSPIGRVKGLVMSAGGVPIQAGGNLLGAVGVSGAPSGTTDERCAQAGIETVQDDLEMMM